MSLEEKMSRLKELSKIPYPSDQEFEEKEKLKEEIKLIYDESHNFEEDTKPVRKRYSILELIIKRFRKKPVTWEQIERLKNEKTVAYLKRDIAKANYERKNPGGKSRTTSTNMKFFSNDRESKSTAQDFKDMVGKNDSNKYRGLVP